MANQNGGNSFSNENMEKGKVVAKNGQFGSLSFRQMDSLSAICDTFMPSIDANSLHQENMDDSFIKFLHTSSSMNGTPQHVRLLTFPYYILCFCFLGGRWGGGAL